MVPVGLILSAKGPYSAPRTTRLNKKITGGLQGLQKRHGLSASIVDPGHEGVNVVQEAVRHPARRCGCAVKVVLPRLGYDRDLVALPSFNVCHVHEVAVEAH